MSKAKRQAEARRGAVRTAWMFGVVALIVYLVSIFLRQQS